MNIEKISQRLRVLRIEKNIPQSRLANDLGISRVTMSYYETGSRLPDIEMVIKMSEYFNCTTDYILGTSDFKNQQEKNRFNEEFEKLAIKINKSLNIREKKLILRHLNKILEFDYLENSMDKELIEQAICVVLVDVIISISSIIDDYISVLNHSQKNRYTLDVPMTEVINSNEYQQMLLNTHDFKKGDKSMAENMDNFFVKYVQLSNMDFIQQTSTRALDVHSQIENLVSVLQKSIDKTEKNIINSGESNGNDTEEE